MKKKGIKVVNNQKGFTLIEIIAVLIILGILAAVAVPKFMNLTEESRNKSAMLAVAEGIARVNLSAGRAILQSGGIPSADDWNAMVLSMDKEADDFTLDYRLDNTLVIITAVGDDGGTASGHATLPQ